MGVTNVRIIGATEGPDSEPWRIVPSLQPVRAEATTSALHRRRHCPALLLAAAAAAEGIHRLVVGRWHRPPVSLSPAPAASSSPQCPGSYNKDVLDGFDYLVSELGKRGMRARVVLGNEWAWCAAGQHPCPRPCRRDGLRRVRGSSLPRCCFSGGGCRVVRACPARRPVPCFRPSATRRSGGFVQYVMWAKNGCKSGAVGPSSRLHGPTPAVCA